MQPNAVVDIPPVIKGWRNARGGSHCVIMAGLFVKITKEEVEEALVDSGLGGS
jgi:hypothetical protein